MSYFFISGLPRSGSSLLASLLQQNPACTAQIQSPLGYSITQLLHSMGAANEAAMFYSEEQRRHIIESVFDAYYEKDLDKIVFDNNRRWCTHVSLLADVFPDSRVICCVRPPAHIVDSIERLLRSNPLYISSIINQANTTVYDRVQILMRKEGLVGYALNAFREAFYGPLRDRLLIVEYARLAQNPAGIMRAITDELKLPEFDYDFEHVQQLPGVAEFDAQLATPGLHTLKERVLYEPRNSILPPDIYKSLPVPFWQVNKAATNGQ